MKKILLFALALAAILETGFNRAWAQNASITTGRRIVFLRKSIEGLEASKKDLELKRVLLLRYGEDLGLNIILSNAEEVTLASSPILAGLVFKYHQFMTTRQNNAIKTSPSFNPANDSKLLTPTDLKSLWKGNRGSIIAGTVVSIIGTEALLRTIWAVYNRSYSGFYEKMQNATPDEIQQMFVTLSADLDSLSANIESSTQELKALEGGQ